MHVTREAGITGGVGYGPRSFVADYMVVGDSLIMNLHDNLGANPTYPTLLGMKVTGDRLEFVVSAGDGWFFTGGYILTRE